MNRTFLPSEYTAHRPIYMCLPDLCTKMQLIGVTMYIADIYEIENNKRLVKDFEVKAFCKALNISFEQLYDDTDQFFEH